MSTTNSLKFDRQTLNWIDRITHKCKSSGVACGQDVCKYCVCSVCDYSCADIIDGRCCTCRGASEGCGVEACGPFVEELE